MVKLYLLQNILPRAGVITTGAKKRDAFLWDAILTGREPTQSKKAVLF